MAAPFEIVAAPADVYVAPVGTAFPLVDAAPAAAWLLLGTAGARNQTEEGVTVTHEQTISTFRGARGMGPRKAFRDAEGLTIGFTLVDITLEQYARVLNNLTVTTVAPATGVVGRREMTLLQGTEVARWALLVRGPSPYGDGWNLQYQVPIVFQEENPAPVFRKGADNAARLAVRYRALEHDTDGFGRLLAQHAAAI